MVQRRNLLSIWRDGVDGLISSASVTSGTAVVPSPQLSHMSIELDGKLTTSGDFVM